MEQLTVMRWSQVRTSARASKPPSWRCALQPGLLHDVLRVSGAAGHPVGDAEQVAAVPLDQRAKRLGVAVLCPGYSRPVAFVHACSLGRGSRNWLASEVGRMIRPWTPDILPDGSPTTPLSLRKSAPPGWPRSAACRPRSARRWPPCRQSPRHTLSRRRVDRSPGRAPRGGQPHERVHPVQARADRERAGRQAVRGKRVGGAAGREDRAAVGVTSASSRGAPSPARAAASLGPADFARTANHPQHGPITVDWLLQMYAWHGRHHVGHLRLIARSEDLVIWDLRSGSIDRSADRQIIDRSQRHHITRISNSHSSSSTRFTAFTIRNTTQARIRNWTT